LRGRNRTCDKNVMTKENLRGRAGEEGNANYKWGRKEVIARGDSRIECQQGIPDSRKEGNCPKGFKKAEKRELGGRRRR